MRGFRKSRTICRRSKWKYCAGVVGCATNMFTVSPSTPSSALSHIWARREGTEGRLTEEEDTENARRHVEGRRRQEGRTGLSAAEPTRVNTAVPQKHVVGVAGGL